MVVDIINACLSQQVTKRIRRKTDNWRQIKVNPENTKRWPNVGLMLTTVFDAGPTLTQHWANVSSSPENDRTRYHA